MATMAAVGVLKEGLAAFFVACSRGRLTEGVPPRQETSGEDVCYINPTVLCKDLPDGEEIRYEGRRRGNLEPLPEPLRLCANAHPRFFSLTLSPSQPVRSA